MPLCIPIQLSPAAYYVPSRERFVEGGAAYRA